MSMIDKVVRTSKKFYCLDGFVAAIFTILAIRAVYVTFFYVSFWNVLSAMLMGIFAYWWLRKVLSKQSRWGSGRSRYSSTQRGNSRNCKSNSCGESYRKIDLN